MVSPLAFVAVVLALPQESARSIGLHDMRVLNCVRSSRALTLNLAPWRGEPVVEDVDRRGFDLDRLPELLQSLIGSGGFGARAEFRLGENGALEVDAAPDVQAEVARLIDGFDGALLGEEVLEVRAFTAEHDAELGFVPTILTAEQADRIEQAWSRTGAATQRRLASIALPDASAVATRTGGTSRYARDFEVEICHGSAIHVPVVEVDETGLALVARAARLDGATWLDLAVREVESLKPSRVRRLEPRSWFTSPDPHQGDVLNATREDLSAATFDGKLPLAIESPQRSLVSIAGSFMIPDRAVLWIPARVVTATGPQFFLLDVRVAGPWRPAVASFDLDADHHRSVSIVHLGALQSRGFAPPRYGRKTFLWPPPDREAAPEPGSGETDERWPSQAHAPEPESDPYGAIAELEGRLRRLKECTVESLTDHHLAVVAPADQRSEVVRLANEALAVPPSFGFHVRIVRGDAAIAEFELPAVARRRVTIWSGVVTTHLRGWDVDVADQSVIGNPDMSSLVDGFALTFAVRPESQRRGLVTVNGAICLLEEPPTRTELGSGFTPVCEKKRQRRLVLDDAQPFDVDGPAATLRFGGSGLAVEVTVTAAAR